MAQETNQSQGPLLCTTGCGFYGNPRNNGMCSVCYKDFLQRQNSNGRASPAASSVAVSSLGESLLAQCSESSTVDIPSPTILTDTVQTSAESSQVLLTPASLPSADESPVETKADLKTEELQASVSAEGSSEGQEKPKAKKNRCFTCRKKVGLTGFDCRCGNVFCGIHRYSDIHSCTFDYKAEAAEKIRKENPVCVGEKIKKI